MARSILEPQLEAMGLELTVIDLGATPFRFDNLVVHDIPESNESYVATTPSSAYSVTTQQYYQEPQDYVKMELDLIWDGQCDIQMQAAGGSSSILGSATKVGVQNIKLQGRLQFLFQPLHQTIPCFAAIQYAFVNVPSIEMQFTGMASQLLGANSSFVQTKIRGILQSTLASMMVVPHRKIYKMNPASSILDMYVPFEGVARITALKGRGFEIEKARFLGSDDVPDVYLIISLGAPNSVLTIDRKPWKTATVRDNLEPMWNETSDFLLSDLDQIVHIEAWDEDSHPLDPDDYLGSAQVTVGDIILAGQTLEVALQDKQQVDTGAFITLSCRLCPLEPTRPEGIGIVPSSPIKSRALPPTPILVPPTETVFTTSPAMHLNGLVTILVSRVHNLPIASAKEAASFVKVIYGTHQDDFVTGIVEDYPGYDALNPIYDCAFHVPLQEGESPAHRSNAVVLELYNGETLLGRLNVPLSKPSLVQRKEPIGTKGALIDFAVSLHYVKEDLYALAASPNKEAWALSTSPVGGLRGGGGSPAPVKSIEVTKRGRAASADGESVDGSFFTAATEGTSEKVRITVVSGKGFEVREKGSFFFNQPDIPDVYCKLRFGSSPKVWRTFTMKDNRMPLWNESNEYMLSNRSQVIHCDVFDANSSGKDDFYGSFRVSVGQLLLNGGMKDTEVTMNGSGTGKYIRLRCELL